MRIMFVLAGLVALSSSASAQSAAPPAFAPCKACHSVNKGENRLGPSLFGVVGRKAGTAPGYAYSDATIGFGKVWDEALLDRYLENPRAVVPGTRMTYPGQKDPAKRAELVAYLKTLK